MKKDGILWENNGNDQGVLNYLTLTSMDNFTHLYAHQDLKIRGKV